jgi:integrase
MAREQTAPVDVTQASDGTRVYRMRLRVNGKREPLVFHERRDCAPCWCGGGWTPAMIEAERGNQLAKVRAGVWRRPDGPTRPDVVRRTMTFFEYVDDWTDRWHRGEFDVRPAKQTRDQVDWALSKVILPHLWDVPVDDDHMDRRRFTGLKAQLIARSDELRDLQEAGAQQRDPATGRLLRPLAPRSIRKALQIAAQVIEQAVTDGHLTHNHARGPHMRVKVPKKTARVWLEMDELVDLVAAGESLRRGRNEKTDRAHALRGEGHAIPAIADALGMSVQNVYYHLAKLPLAPNVEARSLITTLGYTGVRIDEALTTPVSDLRLHAPPWLMTVGKSKTEAGVRQVTLSPVARDELLTWLGASAATPERMIWPRSYSWALGVVAKAAALASERRVMRGLQALPERVTPHTLRHTYISIALLASGGDTAWVADQVGHTDTSMIDRIYRHMMNRMRNEGPAFDALMQEAADRLADPIGSRNGSWRTNWHIDALDREDP